MCENRIPKVIHYCWFGKNEIPENLKKYMESWKEFCPDYEIKEWNEDNYNVYCNKYSAEAYNQKKYAYVSDVARFWIIYNYGGIYLDTDVMLKTNIDELLDYDAWFAGDTAVHVSTGLGFGAKKGNALVKKILDDYNDKQFTLDPCIIYNTRVIKKAFPGIIFKETQVVDNIKFISFQDYGKYARHMYNSINSEKKEKGKFLKFVENVKWKLFKKIQIPRMLRYCDTHTNVITKLYLFFVYDFWVAGFKSVFNVFKYKYAKARNKTKLSK